LDRVGARDGASVPHGIVAGVNMAGYVTLMSQPNLTTILHISDFHFAKRKYREQEIVVDALIADLAKICVGRRRPDLVMFTGDLVHAAGVDQHDAAYDLLIDRVSKVTGCSDERIFIAPGNHDLSWSGVEQFADETNRWRALVNTSSESAEFNRLFEERAFDKAIAAKFGNYIDLERFLNGDPRHNRRSHQSAFATVDHIMALNVDIVTFNTAVLSTGGHKSFAKDASLLIVPEYAVMEAARSLKSDSLRIFVTHHPFSHLSEQSAKYLEGEIARHAHVHLFGHMHDPQPKRVIGLKGEVLANQAGALFTARKEYYNGYSLITIDRTSMAAETMVRSYFKERNEFDEGVDIIEGGKWWSSPEARTLFQSLASPVDSNRLRKHLKGPALVQLEARERDRPGAAHDHEKFVAPPLRRTFINDGNKDQTKVEVESTVDFTQVVQGDANLILYARSEFGRTTLLQEIRMRLLRDADSVNFPRLPVLMDFSDVSANAANVLRKARGFSEALPDGQNLEAFLQLGHICVIIDDVIFSSSGQMRALREFISKYPKCRYILSSPYHSANKMGACIDPEMPVRFEFVEIKELKRADMRQLLQKEEKCTDVEDWLDRLQNEFKEINLPFTAANGSIFIEILSERHNFTPINRSVLMEQFIDSTLRKAAVEQSRRETFDYTNKTDLLSYLAAWMAQVDDYAPKRESVREQMSRYVDTRGLNANLSDLLREFLAARILIQRPDDRVSFRYRGVREYFVALRMSSDPKFKAWIIDESRYLRFFSEIGYYAGKVRNDGELLQVVAQRHEDFYRRAVEENGGVDLSDFDNLILPADKQSQDLDVLEHVIGSAPMDNGGKDAELEADDYDDDDDNVIVVRKGPNDALDCLTTSLVLYSSLVKNLEFIADEEKRRALGPIWTGWATILLLSLRSAPKMAKLRRIRIGGALYEVQAPQGMNDNILLRKMMLLLPHIHIRLLASAVGTEKLERQLSEPMLDEVDEAKIVKLLRAGVISELRLDATPAAVEETVEVLSGHMYLLWSLVIHMGELRRLDRVREHHYKKLMSPLAGAIASLRGGNVKSRSNAKRQSLVQLRKDSLMLAMKKKKEKSAAS
jgi:predicted MPP superfamily phosphohydrolase